ncbi:MAG: glycosyltransferase family 4 protein [Tissierellia bacterium]|nr:glycosyltransferase family 4 protein [Tissierellia bacterium]
MSKILLISNHGLGFYNFKKELMGRLLSEGYEVHFAVPYDEKLEEIISMGATYHRISIDRRGINPIEDIKLLFHFNKLIGEIKPDLILSHTIKPNIYASLAAKYRKIPYINNITGLGSALQNNNFLSKILILLYKISLSSSSAIFFENEGNCKYFEQNKIGNKTKYITVPGAGVNIAKYMPFENKNDMDKLIFLFIGRIMKDKGIDEYIEAAKLIKKEKDNIRFQVLGFFDDDTYKNKIEEFERSGVIEYLGVSDDTRLEMKNADCIVLPSYHEGMSNVLLEGAAMGKPLITTNIHGCKEAVDDGENGFLCNPKDAESLKEAINKFINLSEAQRKEMGRLSREKVVKEFDRNIVVDQYINKIDEIIYIS